MPADQIPPVPLALGAAPPHLAAWDDDAWLAELVAAPRVVLCTLLLGTLAAAGRLAELQDLVFAAEIRDIGERFAALTGIPMPELPDALANLPVPPLDPTAAPQSPKESPR
jgi:hypothetical protein